MNLSEVYQKTPVERHGDIKVIGDRVLLKTEGSGIDEYILGADGELWLMRSSQVERQDLLAIRAKLSI